MFLFAPVYAADPYQLPHHYDSSHLTVYWGDEGAVDEGSAVTLAGLLEQAWQTEVETLGMPDPGSLKVYIGDSGGPEGLGAAGYFRLGDDGEPMLVFARATLEDPPLLEGVTAHELFHALQYASGSYREDSDWFWEASAVWVEAEVHPDSLAHARFVPTLALRPDLPLTTSHPDATDLLERQHDYGAFLYPRFLSEEDGEPSRVVEAWRRPTGDALQSLGPLRMGDYAAAVAGWKYRLGEDYAATVEDAPYDERPVVARVPVGGTGGEVPAPEETLPQGLGFNLISYANPPAGTLRITLDLAETGSSGTPAVWEARLVTPKGVQILPVDGSSFETELSGEETEVRVAVAVANAGAEGERFPWSYAVNHPLLEDARTEETVPPSCGCVSYPEGGGWTLLLPALFVWRRRTDPRRGASNR